MIFYPRKILSSLEKELTTKQAVVLTGMRRTGKTTLLKHLLGKTNSDNKVLLDFENPLHRKIFEEENYDHIWENLAQFKIRKDNRAFLFLDEIQNLPSISSVAKYFIDHFETKFFLTGSSSFYLKNLFPESMSNRKFVFELFPLTFAEFLDFKGVKREEVRDFAAKSRQKNYLAFKNLLPLWKEYIEFGGFPEVVLETSQERKVNLLTGIFTSYYERDVKTLSDFRDLSKLRDCILLLADRVGSKIDIVKIASSLALSRETVYNYLEFLENSYFISLLPKYTGSIDRRVAGGKKVYLSDTGLVKVLGHPSIGQLFESAVFETLRPDYSLSFFEKDGRSEIDFIIGEKYGLEVKTTSSKRDLHNLNMRLKASGLKHGFLISQEYTSFPQTILATDL